MVWGWTTILSISIGTSSLAEVSLWDKMLKEERKYLQKSPAVHPNPIASTWRATVDVLVGFQLRKTSCQAYRGFKGY